MKVSNFRQLLPTMQVDYDATFLKLKNKFDQGNEQGGRESAAAAASQLQIQRIRKDERALDKGDSTSSPMEQPLKFLLQQYASARVFVDMPLSRSMSLECFSGKSSTQRGTHGVNSMAICACVQYHSVFRRLCSVKSPREPFPSMPCTHSWGASISVKPVRISSR